MTDSKRWARIHELFNGALDRPAEERDRYLDNECAGDRSLRAAVDGLLAADQGSPGFLETPVARVAALEPEPRDDAAQRFPPYRIVRPLGAGGMGEVLLGLHEGPDFRRYVAIKVMRGAAPPDFAPRFALERSILSRLRHPGIARFLDGGTTPEGLPYFVMEYVEGERLDRYADRQLLTVRERVELCRQICSAVQHAHNALVVHRDLKPANILVTPDGSPKLLDFGIAKLLAEDATHGETRTGLRVATPEYGSPEQLRGDPVTTASDIYSLGILLYEVLSGHRPFTGRDAVARAPLTDADPPPPPSAAAAGFGVRRLPDGETETITPEDVSGKRRTGPHELRRAVRGDLDNIVLRAIRHDPHDRYISASALGDELQRFLSGLPVRARADSLGYRMGKFVRRNRFASAVSAGLLLTLAVGSLWVGSQNLRIRAQAAEIADERDRAEEVIGFLTSLFQSADPNVTIGTETSTGELLERGADRITSEFADRPLLRSDLLGVIGPIYLNLGDYERSRDLLEQAIRDRKSVVGSDEKTAMLLTELGGTLNDLGDEQGAEAVFEEAITIARASAAPRVEAIALGRLAWVRRTLSGEITDSTVRLVELGVALQRAIDSVPDDLMQNLSILGVMERNRGNLAGADTLYGEALEISQRQHGDLHPNTVQAMNNVGVLKQSLGEWDEAVTALQGVRDGWLRIYGPDHYFVGNANRSLATALANRGDIDGALEAIQEALRAYRSVVPDDHSALAGTMQSAGSMLRGLTERYDESIRWTTEASAMWRRLYGPLDPRVSESMGETVAALSLSGRHAEAEEMSRLRLQELVDGNSGDWVARSTFVRARASALAALGRQAEAHRQLVGLLEALPADQQLDGQRTATEELLTSIETSQR